ncbi:MAG: APC family permease [Candidatus Dormibacteraeota bacterium]|nr:APC family permease [Candidatus Dormibacteraeota bacterium]
MAAISEGAKAGAVGGPRMKRDVGMVGLMFASVGSIIGSGWLFGALNASLIAGPASLISWLLGGAAVILLALIHAELGGMYPVAGGSARFPHYAFGSLIGFASGWFAFLGSVTTAPIEVLAALTYASGYISSGLHVDLINGAGLVTAPGFVVAAALMLIFSIINVLGVKWLAETNKIAVWWKIAIPAITIVVLLIAAFHTSNFTAGGSFSPFGWKGIFTAIPAGGVIFAYLGFEQAIQLGAETKNPKRNIPLAVIGSMVIGIILYLGLALAFIAALDPKSLAHGWAHIPPASKFGPFAEIFTSLGLPFFAVLIYIDAVISPGGTGLLYVGTSARLTFALGRNRYIPSIFAQLSTRGVPVFAIIFSFVIGLLLFLPFPSWASLVGFISSATVITYAMAPLAMGALRFQDPDRERPFRLLAGSWLAPLGFVVANMIILFSGWATDWKLIVAIILGFILLGISAATRSPDTRPSLDWRSGAWVWPYLVGIGLISYLGSFGPDPKPILGLKGAIGVLPYGIDILVMAVFSLAIYALAMYLRLPNERVHEYLADLTAEAEEEEATVVTA